METVKEIIMVRGERCPAVWISFIIPGKKDEATLSTQDRTLNPRVQEVFISQLYRLCLYSEETLISTSVSQSEKTFSHSSDTNQMLVRNR